MVAGYVVMRVPMIFLWARAARDDPGTTPAAITYIWTISVAQVFWVVLAIVDLPIGADARARAVFDRGRDGRARSSQSAAKAEHRGTRTTSQSAMACS